MRAWQLGRRQMSSARDGYLQSIRAGDVQTLQCDEPRSARGVESSYALQAQTLLFSLQSTTEAEPAGVFQSLITIRSTCSDQGREDRQKRHGETLMPQLGLAPLP